MAKNLHKKRGQKIPEVLTEEESTLLLKQPNPRYPTGLRNLCMMRLMLDAGLRSAEVLALKVRDIQWNTGRLKVVQGKGSKDRILWLNEDALQLLLKWRKRQSIDEGLLFTTLKGDPVQSRYLRAMVKRYGKRARLEKDVHPHMLRHSFATDLFRDTKNIRLVQKALGHANLGTTMIYTHIVDEELEGALKGFRGEGEAKEEADTAKQVDNHIRDKAATYVDIGEPESSGAQELTPEERKARRKAWENRECPQCAEVVKRKAKVCRFCQYSFEDWQEQVQEMEVEKKLARQWQLDPWEVTEFKTRAMQWAMAVGLTEQKEAVSPQPVVVEPAPPVPVEAPQVAVQPLEEEKGTKPWWMDENKRFWASSAIMMLVMMFFTLLMQLLMRR
jgi:integrase/recombinase XerD